MKKYNQAKLISVIFQIQLINRIVRRFGIISLPMYFNRCSSVCVYGKVVARTAQYSIEEGEVRCCHCKLQSRSGVLPVVPLVSGTPRVELDWAIPQPKLKIHPSLPPFPLWVYQILEETVL